MWTIHSHVMMNIWPLDLVLSVLIKSGVSWTVGSEFDLSAAVGLSPREVWNQTRVGHSLVVGSKLRWDLTVGSPLEASGIVWLKQQQLGNQIRTGKHRSLPILTANDIDHPMVHLLCIWTAWTRSFECRSQSAHSMWAKWSKYPCLRVYGELHDFLTSSWYQRLTGWCWLGLGTRLGRLAWRTGWLSLAGHVWSCRLTRCGGSSRLSRFYIYI